MLTVCRRVLWIAAVLPLGCTGQPQPDSCGEGTVEQNGVCVPDLTGEPRCGEGTFLSPDTGACEPLVACGDGTVLVDGQCEPEAVCGPGTSLDLATGACAPDITCGPGTVVDAETGVCVPLRTCGAGTTLNPDTNTCEQDFPCADGSVFDEALGLCVSALVCGAGQVVIDGLCVDPDQGIALGADFTEQAPDLNDPLHGGTPEAIALAEDGETVFVGTIGRPADISGNGSLTQDRDVWRFEGAAGTYLRVEVLSLGVPAPVFILEGPNGYRRSSSVGYEAEADRELILPYDGTYDLTVVPTAFLTSGVPVGSPDADYVARITELARPGYPVASSGDDVESATLLEFGLRDLSDNFFGINAPALSPVVMTFHNFSGETLPSVLVFNDAWELVSERQVIEEDDFVGVFVPFLGSANVVIDWRESTGPDDAVQVRLFEVPLVDRGVVPSDASASTGSTDVPGYSAAAFRVVVEDQQVIAMDINGAFNPDVQILGPGGTRSLLLDDDDFFFFADPGEYFTFVFNDQTADDTDVNIVMSQQSPLDLGALTFGMGAQVEAPGPDLVFGFGGFERTFAVVRAEVPSLLQLSLLAEAGDPDLAVYAIDGNLLRRIHRPHLGRAVHIVNRDPRPLLIEVDADDQALVGWTLGAEVSALPAILDTEPNDTRTHAVPVGSLPAQVRGVIGDDEVDVYRVDLEAPLLPTEALRVHFDNMESDNGFGFITDGAAITVRNASFQPLASLPDVELGEGVLGVNTDTFVPGFEEEGPYYVHVAGAFITQPSPYLLTVDVVDQLMENEPNDDASQADPLGEVPTSVVGYRDGVDGDDVFTFELPADLGEEESLLARIVNLENNNPTEVTIADESGQLVATSRRVLNTLQVPALTAGSYTLTVAGPTGGEFLFLVDVSIGAAVEVEPNDSAGLAQDIGTLTVGGGADASLTRYGTAAELGPDYLTFSLDAPLTGDQSLWVELLNLDDSSSNLVELFDGVAPPSSPRLATDRGPTGLVVDAVPGKVGPFLVRLEGGGDVADRYRLRVFTGGPAEAEPNDDEATATTAGWPVEVSGSIRPGDLDVWALAVAAGDEVRIQMDNRSDGSNVSISLREPTFDDEITSGTGFRVIRTLEPALAGTYFVVVTQDGDPDDASDIYTLQLTEAP